MYNVEQYIERCLQSVFDQDNPSLKYEVILINDGSPDDSQIIAEAYCKDRSNIKIIRQNNKGLGGARNTGIEHGTGDYLLFLDSDDWLMPNALSKLSAAINNEDIIEFSVLVKNDDKTINTIDFENTKAKPGVDYFLENKTINSACNKIYKRSFLVAHNLIFKEKIYGEDIQFNSRAFYLARKIRSIDDHLIVYYQSTNSITRNQNFAQKLKYLNDRKEIILSLKTFEKEFGCSDAKTKRYFYERNGSLIVNSILSALKNKIPSAIIREFVKTLKQKKVFHINRDLQHRNLYRKLFHNKISMQTILMLNNLRGK